MFATIISLFTRYSLLIKYVSIVIVVLMIGYKLNSFVNDYNQLKIDKSNLTTELKSTKFELSKAISIANANVKIAEKIKEDNDKNLRDLDKKHKKEIENIKKTTIIKEKTYYEKDSDFIAPVLRNTIDRLWNNSTSN